MPFMHSYNHLSIIQQILLGPMLDVTEVYLVRQISLAHFFSQDAETLVK